MDLMSRVVVMATLLALMSSLLLSRGQSEGERVKKATK